MVKKVIVTPLTFSSVEKDAYEKQIGHITNAVGELMELTAPVMIGDKLPKETQAVIIPVLVGEVYRMLEAFRSIKVPVILLTSEFTTIAMWDWEIRTFLLANGIEVFAPYEVDMVSTILRTIACRQEMQDTTFLIYQDTPGDGMQPEIFKRFYWWEQECTDRMTERFGITVEKRSLKELGCRADKLEREDITDECAYSWENIGDTSKKSALKLYRSILEDIEQRWDIGGIGMNCLNESFYLKATPCIAWDLLFLNRKILWSCEGDILSLLTKFILYHCLEQPVMMTNIYPFLMGMAAIKHEKMKGFPHMDDSHNCLLAVHCGYFGCMPKEFAKEWSIKPKVLEIVNEDALAIDARYPLGDITIVQLHQGMDSLLVVEGVLEKYVGYENTDCRNGAVIRIKDGYAFMQKLYSHHAIIIPGKQMESIRLLAQVLKMKVEGI